ncbi:TerB N-terminal domain-containing protein [Enorma phocaeensis]|uniref:TerB N-terminal domain-containing protein n=1 Tax=Enorma phocaeensis TaxID=1871019 RepID=UPI0023544739|nr:TerB N-terminal domain-containing protein [Enorma phocaeensis]
MSFGIDGVHDVRELIERINASERLRGSSHFSSAVYRNEPIITTGRQMASYLPERYREMRKISRWQEGSPRGRWLSDAELFYRQSRFMEDFEDDCPYHGDFTAYYPTYTSMSDRQLRGYFTWRAAVRRGDVQEAPLSFAYVYLYELINGIGTKDALDGFHKLESFWQTYRTFAPSIDRYVRTWLRDYVVYHGLDPALLADSADIAFDRALLGLVTQSAPFDPEILESIDIIAVSKDDVAEEISTEAPWAGIASAAPSKAAGNPLDASVRQPGAAEHTGRTRGRRDRASALPLPPDIAHETELLAAIDMLSSYRVRLSRLYKDEPDALRHVACAVYVRLLAYYRRHRKNGFVETLFGEELNMSYTMFANAVFFEPQPHQPTDYQLDPIHWYRCRNSQWRCLRVCGTREKSPVLGKIMRAVDRKLRDALDYPHKLKDQQLPKYLDSMIEKEISAWTTWAAEHAARKVEIDLSQLAGIRSAAAWARDALLTEEEREDADETVMPEAPLPAVSTAPVAPPAAPVAPKSAGRKKQERGVQEAFSCYIPPADDVEASADGAGSANGLAAGLDASAHAGIDAGLVAVPVIEPITGPVTWTVSGPDVEPFPGPVAASAAEPGAEPVAALTAPEHAYLEALLAGCPGTVPADVSEDMLVDKINEKLFDLIGDTVIEFGADGPRIIEDYEDDVREVLAV